MVFLFCTITLLYVWSTDFFRWGALSVCLTPLPLETRFGDEITWILYREGIGAPKRVKNDDVLGEVVKTEPPQMRRDINKKTYTSRYRTVSSMCRMSNCGKLRERGLCMHQVSARGSGKC